MRIYVNLVLKSERGKQSQLSPHMPPYKDKDKGT